MHFKNYFNFFRLKNFNYLNNDQKNIIKNTIKTIPNSLYLIYGEPGCGKTTFARIFAQCVGSGDINDNQDFNNVYEYNCSKMSIDDIKKVFDQSYYQLSSSKYRFIILDEVHALSKSAQTTLLYYTEEADSDLKVIIITTDIKSLIDAIISRAISIYVKMPDLSELIYFSQHIAYFYNTNIDLLNQESQNTNKIIEDEQIDNFCQHIKQNYHIKSYRDIITNFILFFFTKKNTNNNQPSATNIAQQMFQKNISLQIKIDNIFLLNNYQEIVEQILSLLAKCQNLSIKYGEYCLKYINKVTNNKLLIIFINILHNKL
ncbi:DNA polymerase III subunit tau [bacterium AB1]|nr:DNA polymerase III subunit tau [bacterium AB1]